MNETRDSNPAFKEAALVTTQWGIAATEVFVGTIIWERYRPYINKQQIDFTLSSDTILVLNTNPPLYPPPQRWPTHPTK